MKYLNYYHCPCGTRWFDIWSCMCNDRCPACNIEIEPYHSLDLFEGDEDKDNVNDDIRLSYSKGPTSSC